MVEVVAVVTVDGEIELVHEVAGEEVPTAVHVFVPTVSDRPSTPVPMVPTPVTDAVKLPSTRTVASASKQHSPTEKISKRLCIAALRWCLAGGTHRNLAASCVFEVAVCQLTY